MRNSLIASLLTSAVFVCSQPGFAQSHDSHAPPAPPDTLAGWAKGAQLFDGLGTFHRKITTRSPLAQKYFDQGMRFVWAFNHDEATRSFAKAAQIDPRCASCYWGVALTLGPNYNMPMMSSPRARVGWQAVHKAEANARRATPVERALIAAVAKRYRGTGEVDPCWIEFSRRASAISAEFVPVRLRPTATGAASLAGAAVASGIQLSSRPEASGRRAGFRILVDHIW